MTGATTSLLWLAHVVTLLVAGGVLVSVLCSRVLVLGWGRQFAFRLTDTIVAVVGQVVGSLAGIYFAANGPQVGVYQELLTSWLFMANASSVAATIIWKMLVCGFRGKAKGIPG